MVKHRAVVNNNKIPIITKSQCISLTANKCHNPCFSSKMILLVRLLGVHRMEMYHPTVVFTVPLLHPLGHTQSLSVPQFTYPNWVYIFQCIVCRTLVRCSVEKVACSKKTSGSISGSLFFIKSQDPYWCLKNSQNPYFKETIIDHGYFIATELPEGILLWEMLLQVIIASHLVVVSS